jgi:hypothetical protein
MPYGGGFAPAGPPFGQYGSGMLPPPPPYGGGFMPAGPPLGQYGSGMLPPPPPPPPPQAMGMYMQGPLSPSPFERVLQPPLPSMVDIGHLETILDVNGVTVFFFFTIQADRLTPEVFSTLKLKTGLNNPRDDYDFRQSTKHPDLWMAASRVIVRNGHDYYTLTPDWFQGQKLKYVLNGPFYADALVSIDRFFEFERELTRGTATSLRSRGPFVFSNRPPPPAVVPSVGSRVSTRVNSSSNFVRSFAPALSSSFRGGGVSSWRNGSQTAHGVSSTAGGATHVISTGNAGTDHGGGGDVTRSYVRTIPTQPSTWLTTTQTENMGGPSEADQIIGGGPGFQTGTVLPYATLTQPVNDQTTMTTSIRAPSAGYHQADAQWHLAGPKYDKTYFKAHGECKFEIENDEAREGATEVTEFVRTTVAHYLGIGASLLEFQKTSPAFWTVRRKDAPRGH